MNILIIITPFTPAQDPNTIRWSSLAKYFINQGHTVHVLTTQRRGVHNSSTQNGIYIHRAGTHTLLDWLYNLFGLKNRRHEPGFDGNKILYRSTLIQKAIDYFWRRNYWPDGQVLFLRPGIKKGAQLIKTQNIDQIVSVGAPFTTHWIAHSLKLTYTHLRWHMDIQDPFSYAKASRINNHNKYNERNIKAETSCFENATTISVPFESSSERYRECFPQHHHKLKVIPPIFVTPESAGETVQLDKSKINLAYFGSFYENIRSPQPLLELLDFIKEKDADFYTGLKFHFIGQQNSYSLNIFNQSLQISKDIEFHGFLQRDHAMALVGKMDYLLNFGNTTAYHLPSRVTEYLYFNKPTINFAAITEDSFASFVNSSLPLLNINSSEEHWYQYQKFKDFVKESISNSSPNPQAVRPYQTDVIGRSYLDLFHSNSV